MNKFYIFALASVFYVSQGLLLAQENLLANGDFENTDYTLFKYESVENCPNIIRGWDSWRTEEEWVENDYNNTGITKYNVRATIQTDDLDENGGNQCVRIQRYEWTKPSDNPYDGALQQTVEIAPNTKYSFSFLYRLSDHAENGTLVPAFYSVDEIDSDGNVTTLLKKKKLYNEMDNKWYSMEKEFTTSSSAKEVRVKVGVTGGYIYSWGGNMRLYADYDNVALTKMDEIADGIYSLGNMVRETRLNAIVEGLNLDVDGVDVSSTIIVADVTGKVVLQLKPKSENVSFDLPSPGLYLVANGRNRKTIKVVVR